MARESLITPEGLEKLKAELEELQTVRRREVAERIKEAREFGDIAENSEYDDAKNEQAMLEQRIAQMEERVRRAIVIDKDQVDTGVVSVLRAAEVPVVLAANKIDNREQESHIDRLWGLGLGEPHPVSAYHGRGVGELLDVVAESFPESTGERRADDVPRVAIVGRPNVGKSTLLNKLVGDQRVIVSDTPGTTRDPIDVDVELDERVYRLIDTAGIRRKPQITENADFYAVLRAREALRDADVAILLVDATDGVTHQDQRIAAEVVEAGVGLVIVLNKWDAIDEEQREATERSLPDRFSFVGWAPVLRMSARTGARIQRLAGAIETVLESRMTRVLDMAASSGTRPETSQDRRRCRRGVARAQGIPLRGTLPRVF